MTLLDLKVKIDEIILANPDYAKMQLWEDGGELSTGDNEYSFHVEEVYRVEESSYLQPKYTMEDKTSYDSKYYTIKEKELVVR